MSSLRRKCKNDPDNFCYICVQYTPPVHCRKFTPKVKIVYRFYFGCEVGDHNKKLSLTYAAMLATQSYCDG